MLIIVREIVGLLIESFLIKGKPACVEFHLVDKTVISKPGILIGGLAAAAAFGIARIIG